MSAGTIKYLCIFIAICILNACKVIKHPVEIKAGGRAGIISVHPNDNKTMLVASETGGLFKTTDGGEHWSHVSGLPSYLVNSVAYSPTNPDIVIATTWARYRIGETGIWRSTNGGRSWSIPTSSRMQPSEKCADVIRSYGIAFEPNNENKIYVGTDCGLAISNDKGETWSHIRLDPALSPIHNKLQNRVTAVLALPNNKVLATGQDGIWHSEDQGATWTKASTGPNEGSRWEIQAFAVSPYDNQHIFLTHLANRKSKLYLSINGGIDWNLQVEFEKPWARPLFVRTARFGIPNPPKYIVYFGEGTRVMQGIFNHGATPSLLGSWTKLKTNHPDPSDIAIHSNGRTPLLLTTDGGVHTLQNGEWRMNGAGSNGFDALQITEITGQTVQGPRNPHNDLYFGTQDNNIYASANDGTTWPFSICCEGFFLRVPPKSAWHLNTKVTGVKCGGCTDFIADAHLSNQKKWPSPPDEDTLDDDDGDPFLLPTPGHYIQQAINNDESPIIHKFKLTKNTGATWEDSFIVDPTPISIPVIAGSSSDPSIYQVVRRPGRTTNGLIKHGLIRVQGVYNDLGTTSITNADITGLGGLGTFATMFAWYSVLGVNPRFTNQLIAPDVESEQMKFSHDGGQTWHAHEQLTDLVTDNGKFAFSERQFPIVTVVKYDPYNPCHVLVGTSQNGIFQSINGGVTWKKIKKSDQVTNVSCFYFPPKGKIWVSTYGRGLWKLRLPRGKGCMKFDMPLPQELVHPLEWDINTGRRFPFTWPPDKDKWCSGCEYIIAKHGVITGFQSRGGLLQKVSISGGFINQYNNSGEEIPLRIPNDYANLKQKLTVKEILKDSAITKQTSGPIRGILIEGTKLRGIITSGTDLPVEPQRIPYIEVLSQTNIGGLATVLAGDMMTISGKGFEKTINNQTTVSILIEDIVVAEDVEVLENGVFRVQVKIPGLSSGSYSIKARQQHGSRVSIDQTAFLVVSKDEE
ncbi:hypothetical protein FK220_011575 [Flavobacteriaceae bacterium TP-CH-4]|uniref:Sortilin N-terminal domain-containing protein n=1 Tax=Pelagihabitans pacificus TaxID=2696054 RepID=A0A967E6U5_9FLAO|nr:hypothetical protein [Pelagihabitans pacificus]NHF59985.1 hypothetical protein [Pelagihabitans pacificus]